MVESPGRDKVLLFSRRLQEYVDRDRVTMEHDGARWIRYYIYGLASHIRSGKLDNKRVSDTFHSRPKPCGRHGPDDQGCFINPDYLVCL